jgi:hypothetical protein
MLLPVVFFSRGRDQSLHYKKGTEIWENRGRERIKMKKEEGI